MKRIIFVVLLCVAFLGYAAPARAQEKTGDSTPGPITATFVGIGGMVFQPGQRVDVSWVLDGDGVKYFESHPWGECELIFSQDGGRSWSRATPQMSVSKRSYVWTVPSGYTKEAMLGLRIGLEGEGDRYTFSSEPFMVLSSKDASSVKLASFRAAEITSGSTIDLQWKSNLPDVVEYEILISSDRGAHFFSVGKSQTKNFALVVPDDYEGSLTVQIVANRLDGSKLKSQLTKGATIKVRNIEK